MTSTSSMSAPTLERCAESAYERFYTGSGVFTGVPWKDLTPQRKDIWFGIARACIGAAMPEMPNDPAGWDATNSVRTYITAVLEGKA